jgi:hypothetical protein
MAGKPTATGPIMTKRYPRSPYFDSCHICSVVKSADQSGEPLSEAQLIRAFKTQEQKQKAAIHKKKIQP